MKKNVLLILMLFGFALFSVQAYATDFTPQSNSFANGTAYEPYSSKITMAAGNEGYKFEFYRGSMPDGLTLSEDGVLSGTPTSSGYYKNLSVKISSGSEYKIVKFSVYISPRKVNAYVTVDGSITDSNAVFDYDGSEHTVSVEFKDTNTQESLDISDYKVLIGSKTANSVSESGWFGISLLNPGGCTVANHYGVQTIIINPAYASISVANKTIKYGTDYSMEVTTNPEGLDYTLKYKKQGETEYTDVPPSSVGTYQVMASINDPNYSNASAYAVLKIVSESAVDFTVSKNSVFYNGEVQKAEITAVKAISGETVSAENYTVVYTNSSGDEVAPKEVGEYTISIRVNNENLYSVGSISQTTFTILPQVVNFTVSKNSVFYNGEIQNAEITAVKAGDGEAVSAENYTVVYTNSSGEEVAPMEVGEYTISIALNDGTFYSVGSISQTTFTILPQVVNFTVSDNSVFYEEGKLQTANVEPTSEFSAEKYTVSYRKQGSEDLLSSVTEVGVYDIVIEILDKNYVLSDTFSGTMTINSLVTTSLNYGNSPAAMIFKDTSRDEEWQNSAFEYFRINNKFSDEYLPSGCVSNVTYYGLDGADADVNTLIVKSTEELNDPGMEINETGVGTKTVYGDLSAADANGIYTLTYNYGDITNTRNVIVLEASNGDINKNGYINVLDANFLQKYLKEKAGSEDIESISLTPETVEELRIYDVNNDNKLDINDIAAIVGRFGTEIQPYYPWLGI